MYISNERKEQTHEQSHLFRPWRNYRRSVRRESSREYDNAVRAAKREWLKEQGLWECFDEVHMVKYGTPKHTTANIRHGILVDDNAEVREAWERYGGETIDPTTEDILNIFRAMIEEEEME